ncbi:target of Sbf, partial [Ascosphaera pollenicola]
MRYSLAAGAILAASISSAVGQECTGSQLLGGNWYCELIESIIYSGFPSSGTYNGVKSMSEDGQCEFGSQSFNSPLGVFGDELSVHVRGPANLKKLAVYSASGSSSNTKRSDSHEHVHAHAHAHARVKRNPEPEPVMVSAVVDNKVVSWEQGPVPTLPPSGPKAKAALNDGSDGLEVTATIFGQVVSWLQGATEATSTAAAASSGDDDNVSASSSPSTAQETVASATSSAKSSSGKVAAGSWGRQAYYDASSGTAEGLVFLNHKGGEGSGVFDNVNGNSLSYASKDAKSGASSPQVLEDTMIEDDNEIVIMSDTKCNGDCGATRPGTVAYHGWSGNNKVFVAGLVSDQ